MFESGCDSEGRNDKREGSGVMRSEGEEQRRCRGGWLWLRGKMAAVRRGWTTAEGREEQRWLTEEEAAKGEGSDDVWLLRQERRKGRLQQWQQWETPP
ncbi:hypothetical protein BHE74_00046261 [Ensete ventricosum]|nr:hypothetical protein BHE74_00046261 [Ensete ventricosum]RZR77667.1 hypothetical protein BHM03_00002790 [Ensete ventricosum]